MCSPFLFPLLLFLVHVFSSYLFILYYIPLLTLLSLLGLGFLFSCLWYHYQIDRFCFGIVPQQPLSRSQRTDMQRFLYCLSIFLLADTSFGLSNLQQFPLASFPVLLFLLSSFLGSFFLLVSCPVLAPVINKLFATTMMGPRN